MFRNQYDNDAAVWSPQGRLRQVEYAMNAVKLGSATVGLKNKTHAVLTALKHVSPELSGYQKKIIPIESHIGISIAGFTADARILSRYMITESVNYKYAHDCLIPVSRLITMLGNKMQVRTQRYDRRPYGVGLLVAGYDDLGPHVYQTCPSANYFDCKAMAIGSRSQSARTYLENHLDEFVDCNCDELIKHGLIALEETLPNEVELTTKNVSIGFVGKGTDFNVFDEEGTAYCLQMMEGEYEGTGLDLIPSCSSEGPLPVAPPPLPPPEGEGPEDSIPAAAMDAK